eukprot:11340690-Karenia_brevis.AAC.1
MPNGLTACQMWAAESHVPIQEATFRGTDDTGVFAICDTATHQHRGMIATKGSTLGDDHLRQVVELPGAPTRQSCCSGCGG